MSETRVIYPKCGQTFLATLDAFNSHFDEYEQAPYLQLNTFNDHEEGSGFEPGIESCLRVELIDESDIESDGLLTWRLEAVDPDGGGPERATDATLQTISHFTLFITDEQNAPDGSNRLSRVVDGLSTTQSDSSCYSVDSENREYSYDINCLEIPDGTYRFLVRAVGIAFVHNELSDPSPQATLSCDRD